MTNANSKASALQPQQLREIAAIAQCDTRTVERRLAGESTRPTVGARIDRAAKRVQADGGAETSATNEPEAEAAALDHAREWWATYRAALTGIYANPGGYKNKPEVAKAAADAAHGPLPKVSK